MSLTTEPSLASYAFNNYGHDAKLYNGIADLESQIAASQERERVLRKALQKLKTEASGFVSMARERERNPGTHPGRCERDGAGVDHRCNMSASKE